MVLDDHNGNAYTAMPNITITPFPENPVVAMAYVPYQQFEKTYPAEKALSAGTLFPELDKPFYGRRGAPR